VVLIQNNPNIDMLEETVGQLGPLVEEVVFLGGCATGLLITDPGAPPLRVTRDVDVMVEVASLPGYHSFTERLRRRGFVEDLSNEAPICRWKSQHILIDVMPTDPELLGFGNEWFARSFPMATKYRLPSKTEIRVLPSPYFLATKIEAFHHRGGGDFLLSRDVEDIVAVLDGRLEMVKEIQASEQELVSYLSLVIPRGIEPRFPA
jgi:hypothetical protein